MRGSGAWPARSCWRRTLPGNGDGLLVGGLVLDESDAADVVVVCREADVDGLDEELALQVAELLLRVEVTPDRLAVVEGASACLRPMTMWLKP